MAAPLPTIKRPSLEEAQIVISQTSQEELEVRHATEERRHQENLKAQEEAAKASEKLIKEQKLEEEKRKKEEEKKADTERRERRAFLKEQSSMFDKTMRTGLLGSLEYAVRNFDDIQKNTIAALSDSAKSFVFGKTIEDQLKIDEGQIRTSLYERLLTGEKYKDDPNAKQEESGGGDETPTENDAPDFEPIKPDEISLPENDAPVERVENPLKPSLDSPIEIIGRKQDTPIDIAYDETAIELEVPLLEKIEKSITGLFKNFTQFQKDQKQAELDRAREKGVEDLTSRLTDDSSPIEIPSDSKFRIGAAMLGGVGAMMGTISAIVSSTIASVGALILKAAPIALLATGLFMAVKDAIGGWFAADDWGVSNLSGLAGGLLGGLESGVWNAFANAGKWAMIGIGIGKFFGPWGMLIGGAIGGLFGGILGYFGGEKIAKVIDDLGTWAWDKIETIGENIKWLFTELPGLVSGHISQTWEDIKSWAKGIFDGIGESLSNMKDQATKYIKSWFTYDGWFGDNDKKVLEGIPELHTSSSIPVEVERVPKEKLSPAEVESSLQKSFESYMERIEQSPGVQEKENRTDALYESSIDNSISNQSTIDTSTTNQQNISGSYNKANINVMSSPAVRNRESSAFGTQSLINSGVGNFSRR